MRIGIVGRKCGMTRVFTEDGVSIPVTVVEASPNHITQVKSLATDGYSAIQVTTGSKKASRVVKSQAGEFALKRVLKLDVDSGNFDLRVRTRLSRSAVRLR